MLKPFVFTLLFIAFTLALFVLAIEVWQGAASLWYFSGSVVLGVLGPLGTWAIVKRYPNTDRAAWVCIGLTGGAAAILALFRLAA